MLVSTAGPPLPAGAGEASVQTSPSDRPPTDFGIGSSHRIGGKYALLPVFTTELREVPWVLRRWLRAALVCCSHAAILCTGLPIPLTPCPQVRWSFAAQLPHGGRV